MHIVMHNNKKNTRKFLKVFISMLFFCFGYVIYMSPAMDNMVGLYDDFIGSQEKRSNAIITMDIPIDTLKPRYEYEFQLPLRRHYYLYLELAVEDGIVIADTQTKIKGHVEIISTNGKVLLETDIPYDYPLDWQRNKLLIFSFRDIGKLNQKATLVVTDLQINKSNALKSGKIKKLALLSNTSEETLVNLRLRVVIHPYYVALH